MKRLNRFPIFQVALFAAIICVGKAAMAVDVTSPLMFAGPTQDFNLNLEATGDITVSGSGVFHAIDNPFFSSHLDIDIPLQTKPIGLNPDTVSFTSNPSGSATLGYDNATLANRTLSDTTIDFNNGTTWSFSFDPIIFDANIETIGDVGLRLEITGEITTFAFTQSPGTVNAPGFYSLPGDFSLSYSASVDAELEDVIFGADFDLGEIASLSDSSTSSVDLPGLMTLTDLGGPLPSDLDVELDLDLTGLEVPLPLVSTGQVVENQGHGGGNLDLTLDYDINAEILLSNLLYHLEDSLTGVVVPEPSSLLLLTIGTLMMRLKRNKNTASPLR